VADAETSKEAMIICLHRTGMSYRAICAQLRVGLHRVVSAISHYKSTGIIVDPLPRGPRKKLTKAILPSLPVGIICGDCYRVERETPVRIGDMAFSEKGNMRYSEIRRQ
jgi:hypothetical protein